MAFILSTNRVTPEQTAQAFRDYRAYLVSLRESFPASAYGLATSDWYFNPTNGPKSPHDAWLETLQIEEQASGERCEIRCSQIRLKLLGAYHDGFIEFFYSRVFNYDFNGVFPVASNGENSHGDWLFDEFTLTERGNVLHEIEWQHGRWKIEADDVQYKWLPREGLKM
jgi:hypothetical protein